MSGYLRIAGHWAARAMLIAYGLIVLFFTAAAVAMIAGHYGATKFQQGVDFGLAMAFLVPLLKWLLDKADL